LQISALVCLMSAFIINTIKAFNYWGSSVFLDKLGMVGVIMCAVTTLVAVILGLLVHQRTWCSFCPMGTVQKNLYKVRRTIGFKGVYIVYK
jgi:polyferredoxin